MQMKTGLILNNFHVSSETPYKWKFIAETADHYRQHGDFVIIASGSGVKPSSEYSNKFDYVGLQSPSNKIQIMHNNPTLIKEALNICTKEDCEKVLLLNPYYRIDNFDFLKEDLALLINEYIYIDDYIIENKMSFDFLYTNLNLIKRAWFGRPWNYNIKNPRENLFENFKNIIGKKMMSKKAKFFTKKQLKLTELVIYWETNIQYIKHGEFT